MNKIKKVGIIANQLKINAIDYVDKIKKILEEYKIKCVYYSDLYMCNENTSAFDEIDLMIVLGGDGTLLNFARLNASRYIPMLGINFGTLGFIAEVEPEDYKEAVLRVLEGDYFLSERIVLKATVLKEAGEIINIYGLNDVVIGKGESVRMLSVDAFINDRFLVNYNADGLIIAGPTGSTAYNLSAGGPVIHPEVKAFVVTPICPHTISERPLVIPHNETLKVCCSKEKNNQKAILSVDGQVNIDFSSEDSVVISTADYTIKFVEFNQFGFYEKLRTRLSWGK